MNLPHNQEMQARRDAALRWANEMRADRGKDPLDELPKGHRCSSRTCPLARATGLWMGAECHDLRTEETFSAPDAVRLFISDFDTGGHPDLIQEDPTS